MCVWHAQGTHQTMARHGLGKCQHRSIADQYEMGVRFLDIRCRWFGDALPIHHGWWFQQDEFWGVVSTTAGFLRDHPRETILMLVKDEKHKTVKGYISFSQLVSFTFGDEGASVLHEVPETLGEARGHVILFHEDWPDNDCELGTALCYYFLLRAWRTERTWRRQAWGEHQETSWQSRGKQLSYFDLHERLYEPFIRLNSGHLWYG